MSDQQYLRYTRTVIGESSNQFAQISSKFIHRHTNLCFHLQQYICGYKRKTPSHRLAATLDAMSLHMGMHVQNEK